MPKPSKTVYKIRQADQLRAISSPERLRIVEALLQHGPLTAAEMGTFLQRVPQALYYHIRVLLTAGILVVDCEEKAKRRPQKRYRLVAPQLKVEMKQESDELKEAIASAVATLLRTAERDYRSSIGKTKPVLTGKNRNFVGRRLRVRLKPRELHRLNDLINQFEQFLEDAQTKDTGKEFAITIVVSPFSS